MFKKLKDYIKNATRGTIILNCICIVAVIVYIFLLIFSKKVFTVSVFIVGYLIVVGIAFYLITNGWYFLNNVFFSSIAKDLDEMSSRFKSEIGYKIISKYYRKQWKYTKGIKDKVNYYIAENFGCLFFLLVLILIIVLCLCFEQFKNVTLKALSILLIFFKRCSGSEGDY